MVERLRDTTDRRGVRVRLTDHGAEELKRVGEERNAYFADLLRSLDEKDLEVADQAADVINRLAEAYGNRVGDSGNH